MPIVVAQSFAAHTVVRYPCCGSDAHRQAYDLSLIHTKPAHIFDPSDPHPPLTYYKGHLIPLAPDRRPHIHRVPA